MRSFATLNLLMLSNAIPRSTWSVEILGMNGGISYLLEINGSIVVLQVLGCWLNCELSHILLFSFQLRCSGLHIASGRYLIIVTKGRPSP